MKLPRHLSAFKYHLPYRLSRLQQMFLLPYFGLKVLNDPTRGDLVAAIGNLLTLLLTYFLIHLFNYSFTDSLNYVLTRSHFLYCLTQSCVCSFTHLFAFSSSQVI